MDVSIERQIKNVKKRKKARFWGRTIAIFSILYGSFTFYHNQYLQSVTEPYFRVMPTRTIGIALCIAGIIKLIGACNDNTLLRKIGIWTLSGLWSGLFIVALTYSFGSGYPSPNYLYVALPMFICFAVSLRGDFG